MFNVEAGSRSGRLVTTQTSDLDSKLWKTQPNMIWAESFYCFQVCERAHCICIHEVWVCSPPSNRAREERKVPTPTMFGWTGSTEWRAGKKQEQRVLHRRHEIKVQLSHSPLTTPRFHGVRPVQRTLTRWTRVGFDTLRPVHAPLWTSGVALDPLQNKMKTWRRLLVYIYTIEDAVYHKSRKYILWHF